MTFLTCKNHVFQFLLQWLFNKHLSSYRQTPWGHSNKRPPLDYDVIIKGVKENDVITLKRGEWF